MSSIESPARSSAFDVAGIGPVSIITGSTPASENAVNRASGVSPSCSALASDMISIAAAPSEICDELPAVTTPSGLKAGCRPASFSMLVSCRMPSSFVMTSPSGSGTGTI